MFDFMKPTHWFQKRASELGADTVRVEQMGRFNALFQLDPDKIVSAVTQYKAGTLGPLARIIDDFEDRDDKMKACSMKMRASAARCDYSILIAEGFEKDARAKLHQEILKRFWSTVRATDRFRLNERGGIRLLKKQMMEAQSFGYAVHEIVWTPLANGEIAAEFIKLPLWHFENRTGELRFIPSATGYDGVPMPGGRWMVTTGDGVGIAASIVAMAKHLAYQDWLLFSERCGIPILHAATGAAKGSDAWNGIVAAVRRAARDFRMVTDANTKLSAIETGHSSNIPYPELVDHADRAIAALYRGADLSTISKGDGAGASLQGDETSLLEQDACANLGETLHEQVDRFVIRYVTGDNTPLAYISIDPMDKPDVDTDIKIDNHLANLGVKLSKADALQRYGRTEAAGDDDALETPPSGHQNGLPDGFGGLPNEQTPATPLQTALQGVAKREEAPGRATTPESGEAPQRAILAAFAKDSSKASEAVKDLLGDPTPEKAKALLADLPSLIPEDPALAAVIAEAMAAEFGSSAAPAPSGALANEEPNRGKTTPDSTPGSFAPKGGSGNAESPKAKAKREKRERQAANKAQGIAGMAKVENGDDCRNFMRSQKLNRIAFYQGNDDEGYLHIKNNPDPNHQEMLKDGNIPNTLAYGKFYEDTYQKFSGWSVVNGDKCVFLGKDGEDGVKIITAYVSKTKAAVFSRRVALENEEM